MSQKHTIAGMITRADGNSTEAKSPAGPWKFIASTAKVDSYSDIVEQGWRLDRYLKNPVILLQHSSWSLPIGKATSAEVQALPDGAPGLVVEFMLDPDDEEAMKVGRKLAGGFLNAVSVGFRSHKQTPRATLPETDPRYSGQGCVLADNELLELSVVTIPANSDAVAQRAKGDRFAALESRLAALEAAVTLPPSPAPSAKHSDPYADLFGVE
jgi:HK97 family phage prohead protease